ncbi:hypothetical protein [Bradyrhizobium sp. SZCCHNS3004]|uniref:hypothetical protein n=1 Tax=Bradyrhizobium sp. SZCCHNS3004 TaxID=3057312 RepID=UPI002915E671|nr:hypothetical protein [Bradyrhizobium sp. SZCCHNS3004]
MTGPQINDDANLTGEQQRCGLLSRTKRLDRLERQVRKEVAKGLETPDHPKAFFGLLH